MLQQYLHLLANLSISIILGFFSLACSREFRIGKVRLSAATDTISCDDAERDYKPHYLHLAPTVQKVVTSDISPPYH